MPKRRWTTEEFEILKKEFGVIPNIDLAKKLNRTISSIQHQTMVKTIPYYKGKKTAQEHKLKFKYGITLDEYSIMWERQKGLCAICGKPETEKHQTGIVLSLAVDHTTIKQEKFVVYCVGCVIKVLVILKMI